MRFLPLLALLITTSSAAQEQAAAEAELYRLGSEMNRLAQKTAWGGVDRAYKSMVALETPLAADAHLMAAQAAIADGDALKALLRLRRVMVAAHDPSDPEAVEARAEAESALNRLATRYGPVSLSVGKGRDPTMVRPQAPFAPDERVAVERAVQRVAEDRAFRGLLPVGSYEVGGVRFDVVAGEDWQSVVLAAVPERR